MPETKSVPDKKQERVLADQERVDIVEENTILDEIARGYRISYLSKDNFIRKQFDVDSIRIYDKTLLNVGRYGDNEFTKERTRLLRDSDFLTQKEQEKVLEERGIWTKENEAVMRDMKSEIGEMIKERDVLFERLEKAEEKKNKKDEEKAKKDLKELGERMSSLHRDLMDLTETYVTYFQDTIEVRAKMRQHMGWMVSAICYNRGDDEYNPDNRLWKDIESLTNDLNDTKLAVLLEECVSFWNVERQEAQSFFGESPEDPILESDGE